MASTLIRSPGSYESGHAFENFIHPPQLLVFKMIMVHFQKPVVSLLFNDVPVSNQLSGFQRLFHTVFFLDIPFLLEESIEYMEIAFVVIVDRISDVQFCLFKVQNRDDWKFCILHIKVHLNI